MFLEPIRQKQCVDEDDEKVVESFAQSLDYLSMKKAPITDTDVAVLTHEAFRRDGIQRLFARLVQNHLDKPRSQAKLVALYLMDSLLRHSRFRGGNYRVFTVRFVKQMPRTVRRAAEYCRRNEERTARILKMFYLWHRNGILSENDLSCFTRKAMIPKQKVDEWLDDMKKVFGAKSDNFGDLGDLKFEAEGDLGLDVIDLKKGSTCPVVDQFTAEYSTTSSALLMPTSPTTEIDEPGSEEKVKTEEKRSKHTEAKRTAHCSNNDNDKKAKNSRISDALPDLDEPPKQNETGHVMDVVTVSPHFCYRGKTLQKRIRVMLKKGQSRPPPDLDDSDDKSEGDLITKDVPSRKCEKSPKKPTLPPIKQGFLSVCTRTVWIGHLPKNLEDKILESYVDKSGPVESVNMIPPRGCAYVCFVERNDAKRFLNRSRALYIKGMIARISWACNIGAKDKIKYFEKDCGCTYVPWAEVDDFDSEKLTKLAVGGFIDYTSASNELLLRMIEDRYKFEKDEMNKLIRAKKTDKLVGESEDDKLLALHDDDTPLPSTYRQSSQYHRNFVVHHHHHHHPNHHHNQQHPNLQATYNFNLPGANPQQFLHNLHQILLWNTHYNNNNCTNNNSIAAVAPHISPMPAPDNNQHHQQASYHHQQHINNQFTSLPYNHQQVPTVTSPVMLQQQQPYMVASPYVQPGLFHEQHPRHHQQQYHQHPLPPITMPPTWNQPAVDAAFYAQPSAALQEHAESSPSASRSLQKQYSAGFDQNDSSAEQSSNTFDTSINTQNNNNHESAVVVTNIGTNGDASIAPYQQHRPNETESWDKRWRDEKPGKRFQRSRWRRNNYRY